MAEILNSGQWGSNVSWEFNDEGELTVTGEGYMQEIDSDSETYPWYPLQKKIKTVIIKGNIDTIAKKAFANMSFTSLIIEDGPTNIGEYCFSNCSNLKNITLSSTVKKIGAYGFYKDNSLGTLFFTDGLEEIGDSAFESCGNLLSITFPNTLKKLGNRATLYTPMEKYVIPESVTYIGYANFISSKVVRCLSKTPAELNSPDYWSLGINNPDIFETIYVPMGSLKEYQKEWPSLIVFLKEFTGADADLEAPDATNLPRMYKFGDFVLPELPENLWPYQFMVFFPNGWHGYRTENEVMLITSSVPRLFDNKDALLGEEFVYGMSENYDYNSTFQVEIWSSFLHGKNYDKWQKNSWDRLYPGNPFNPEKHQRGWFLENGFTRYIKICDISEYGESGVLVFWANHTFYQDEGKVFIKDKKYTYYGLNDEKDYVPPSTQPDDDEDEPGGGSGGDSGGDSGGGDSGGSGGSGGEGTDTYPDESLGSQTWSDDTSRIAYTLGLTTGSYMKRQLKAENYLPLINLGFDLYEQNSTIIPNLGTLGRDYDGTVGFREGSSALYTEQGKYKGILLRDGAYFTVNNPNNLMRDNITSKYTWVIKLSSYSTRNSTYCRLCRTDADVPSIYYELPLGEFRYKLSGLPAITQVFNSEVQLGYSELWDGTFLGLNFKYGFYLNIKAGDVLAFQCDGTWISIFINGVFIMKMQRKLMEGKQITTLGCGDTDPDTDYYFNALQIEKFLLYDRILSEAELKLIK